MSSIDLSFHIIKGYNMKNLLLGLLALLFVSNASLYASNEHVYSIRNINRISANSLQFEVWLKNVSTTPTDTLFILSPTLNINFNYAIANGGNLSITQEDISGYAKSLTTDNQPNAPVIDASQGATNLIIRSNGVSSAQDASAVPKNSQVFHYTLVPGDSVIVALFTLATDAATFAVQPANLAFRPFSGASPVTSCSYFKRFAEGGTSYFCKKSGTKYTSPAQATLSTSANETYSVDAAASNMLPVELTSFASAISGRDVNLTWKTATEVNFSKFVIERSAKNAGVWSQVGIVNASGNSSSAKSYMFADKKLNTGSYEYRLKMVDNDGSFTYSNSTVEATVAKPRDFEISQNYPNPFNPTTKVDYQLSEDARVVVEIYNIAGQKIAQVLNDQQAAGYYTMPIGSNITSSLASGIYLYRIAAVGTTSNAKFVSIKKMVLMK
jgi:hypothetical protein